VSTKSSTSRSSSAADALVDTLPGIGASTARALRSVGIRTAFDLVCTLPNGILDLRTPLMGEAIRAAAGKPIVVRGTVEKVSVVPMRGRRAIRVGVRSNGELVELWWFFMNAAARTLSGEIVAAGMATADPKKRVVRMAHPRTYPASRTGIEPVYAVPGLGSARVAAAIRDALPAIDDSFDPGQQPGFSQLLRAVHTPDGLDAHIAAREELRTRLARTEVAWLIARRLEREQSLTGVRAPRLIHKGDIQFPFALTAAQERAIDFIGERLTSDRPSRTLLTGDVGTGKTAVLLAAVARTIASGYRVAILAPTTILADQYMTALSGFNAAIAGKDNTADVIVGTHVLLSERVQIDRLGLVIVDEQHRLGVGQRMALVRKGEGAHLITVSATPIPRTLSLALRGEIASVHLDERPPGRTTPATIRQSVWPEEAIAEAVSAGDRVFVVCATIEDSEDGLAGASTRAKELGKRYRVGLVHGGIDDDDARETIAAFRRGEHAVLVGTSMLEVGLDVPDATLMVIDRAERLGLAQLHQLRGRVGRGSKAGTCILVHGELSDIARARLDALVRTSDGMEVARADLSLRGPGDLDGARQAGAAAGLRYLDPLRDEELARDVAEHPPAENPGLLRVFARLDALAIARGAREEAG
jgi:ATP-dependent DNA helicase RecG